MSEVNLSTDETRVSYGIVRQPLLRSRRAIGFRDVSGYQLRLGPLGDFIFEIGKRSCQKDRKQQPSKDQPCPGM